jgi:Tol biopolymer transport system component
MIYLGRIDGGPARVLAPVRSGEVFTWAPDSRKFAYSRMNGPDVRSVTGLAPKVPSTQVVVAEIDGTEEEVVLEKPGYWTAADWSPDGNRLLLIYDPTRSTQFGRSDLIELDLNMARREKERLKELQPAEDFASGRTVEYCLNSLTDGQPIGWFVEARYSPDGKSIAVVFSRRARLIDPGFHELGLFDIASETVKPIVEVPNPEVIGGPICWSPDGTEILFARREIPEESNGQLPNIWAIRPDGTEARFLTQGWSPDWR